MPKRHRLFKAAVFWPQDHGAWVFLLSPLLIGLYAGKKTHRDLIVLVLGALATFLLRQPVTTLVKIRAGRRSREDLPTALVWTLFYGIAALIAFSILIIRGYFFLLYLIPPALLVFGWHLYLVSKRAERRQAGVEIVASGVLALAAPAAYWMGRGSIEWTGWALWLLTWLQSAASIVYIYVRLEQRGMIVRPTPAELLRVGRRAMLYAAFNLALSAAAGLTDLFPRWLFLPYLLQAIETLWGILNPAIGVKPTRIGLRQLIVSAVFTGLFILVWK